MSRRIGVGISVNLDKIDEDRCFKNNKGTFLDLTTFIDLDESDEFGNNGIISQKISQEEKERGKQLPILGNAKIFWTSE